MSLKEWEKNKWLRPHKTSVEEIANLLAIVARDMEDASSEEISVDWRFGIAYNAALKLCTILLYSEGYRAERANQHYWTIQTLPFILEENSKADADYLDACRKKRNIVEYDYVGGMTENDAEELIQFVKTFRERVMVRLKTHHPDLLVPRKNG